MTAPRIALACLLSCAVLLALAVACGGGDDAKPGTGRLTDPKDVPTATPWPAPPDVIILDPNSIQPIPPLGGGSPTPTAQPGEPGVCGTTYTVVADDTLFGIADKCGVGSTALQDANADVDPKTLHIGQVLNVPPKPAETPAPEPTEEPPPEEITPAPTEEATPAAPTEAPTPAAT